MKTVRGATLKEKNLLNLQINSFLWSRHFFRVWSAGPQTGSHKCCIKSHLAFFFGTHESSVFLGFFFVCIALLLGAAS